jgi:transposase
MLFSRQERRDRMPKPIRLRPLTGREQLLLRRKIRDLSLAARVHQRYRVIAEVRAGRPVVEAAERVGCHFTAAYGWVHRFNASGFASFELVPNPRGRPPILKSGQLRELVDTALSSPLERGLPFSTWSIHKLAEYCRLRRLLPPVTDEWVRRLLRREGISAQRIRTWKTSNDPHFDRKKNESGRSIGAAHRRRRWSASTSGAPSS